MFDYKVKYKFNQTIPYSVELSSQSQLTIALFIFTSTFSFTTNFLNILVFLNSKMKNSSFSYLLSMSFSNFLYSLFVCYGSILFCDECFINYVYFSQLYRIIIFYYACNFLLFFSIVINLTVSIQHYLIFKNKNYFEKINNKWIIIGVLIFSMVYNLNYLFTHGIQKELNYLKNQTSNSSIIQIQYSNFLNQFGIDSSYLMTSQSFIQIIINVVFLSLINLANLNEFNKRYQQRLKLKYREQSSKYLSN